MTPPTVQTLYAVTEATWPPIRAYACGPFTLRVGGGAGSRVSAATVNGPFTADDIDAAEAGMDAENQPRLFMIRDGDAALDAALAARGYAVKDPVTLYCAPIGTIATHRPPPVTTFEVWPPLAIQTEIWAEGGIGPARLSVMERAAGPKHSILARLDEQPAGTMYIGIQAGIAMFHALEVRGRFRRRGLGADMIRSAAFWARDNGASHLSLVVTQANVGGNALYSGLGFAVVGQYHYRIQEKAAHP